MLTMHALTAKLQNQTLTDRQFYKSNEASKIRHHSEPEKPITTAIAGARSKKIKVISFQESCGDEVSSILLGASPDNSTPPKYVDDSVDWEDDMLNPPLKRQCRSQSIPGDGQLHSQWLQSQTARRLHKPLPVRPHSGGSRSKSNFHHIYGNRPTPSKLPTRVWNSTPTYDFYHTPPESPVPRPSSASSGYYDSPLASINNLSKQRCDSLQQLPTRGIGLATSLNSAKSMPSVALLPASMPSSPNRHRLPRCRSQPCVMHERRAGVKRRRDDEQNRPCLNFNKMTETAYGSSEYVGRSSEFVGRSSEFIGRVRSSPLNVKSFNSHSTVFSKAFQERVLQTIASSPQDNSLSSSPKVLPHLSTSPSAEVDLLLNRSISPTNDNASDSGCSTSDEDNNGKTGKGPHCAPGTSSSHEFASEESCDCDYLDASDTIFPMEAIHGELDLDMIEND